eukprot:TRINITY_DN10016_c0_g1_i1.p1 TRINITY_DN10016_c0_g1~~TRINITY_DN10016_c0_g1_i1.p1  ORF type:complete len:111 (+),score=9.40 TRINITY_DN10016_c0_g1_i1:89-421(+)
MDTMISIYYGGLLPHTQMKSLNGNNFRGSFTLSSLRVSGDCTYKELFEKVSEDLQHAFHVHDAFADKLLSDLNDNEVCFIGAFTGQESNRILVGSMNTRKMTRVGWTYAS